LQTKVPLMPSGLPSSLLERRPDIAGAERRVAAANASIGVAQAAYFPNLTLGAGATNPSIPTLLGSHPMIWSLGANLAATIFDGGARSAQTAQARANYDAAVAQYKQTVLNGFQEVEDNLAALRILQQESAAQNDALKAAQAAEQVTMSQYQAGTANFVSVTTAQNLRLSNERAAVQLLGRQLAASVALIKALGGGWNSAQLQQTPAMHTANSAN
jgi:NodT family efflux transporter outer membrane factor (OMF) lipoprotein